jgi:hypothetical protein
MRLAVNGSWIAIAALAVTTAHAAHAKIAHTVTTEYIGPTDSASEFDDKVAPLGSDPELAFVFINGENYQSVGSIGPTGQFGFDGQISFGSGSLRTDTTISASGIPNLTSVPQVATSNVLIDGGAFTLDFSSDGSSLLFEWALTAVVTDALGTEIDRRAFRSEAELAWSSGTLDATITGFDLGMTFDALTSTITVPASLQSFDLGVIPPDGALNLIYEADAFANIPFTVFTEFMRYQFSDPATVGLSGAPELVDVALTPVPVPAALPLLASGVAGLALLRRSTRRRHPDRA